jgi:hypothetical protein
MEELFFNWMLTSDMACPFSAELIYPLSLSCALKFKAEKNRKRIKICTLGSMAAKVKKSRVLNPGFFLNCE